MEKQRQITSRPLAAATHAAAWCYRLGRELLTYGNALVLGRRLPAIRFVLFSDGRVGSELLVDLLNSHPQVRCESEILHFPALFPGLYIRGRAAFARQAAYGFKLLNYQLQKTQRGRPARQLMARLHEQGWKIVYMSRANLLRQAVSGLVSLHRKQWHSQIKEGPLQGKVPIDCRELMRIMKAIESDAVQDAQTLRGLPHLSVVYERHLLDSEVHQQTANRVFRFLGLPFSDVQTKFVKITPPQLCEFVENYAELRQAVSGTRFASFLEEERA